MAILLNGTSEGIVYSASGNIFTSVMSMGCWFYPTDSQANTALMWTYRLIGTHEHRIRTDAGGTNKIAAEYESTTGVQTIVSSNTWTTNAWNHVWAYFDPSGAAMTIFLNGAMTNGSPLARTIGAAGKLSVGSNRNAANWFAGRIAEPFVMDNTGGPVSTDRLYQGVPVNECPGREGLVFWARLLGANMRDLVDKSGVSGPVPPTPADHPRQLGHYRRVA